MGRYRIHSIKPAFGYHESKDKFIENDIKLANLCV